MLAVLIVLALTLPVATPPIQAERRLMLTGFDRVRVDGPFTVEIRAGPRPNRVVGDPHSIEAVQVRLDGRTLVVSPARDDRGRPVAAPSPVIELSTDRLTAIAADGAGTIRIDRMAGPRVDIALSGDGVLTIGAVEAEVLTAMVIGSGRLTLSGKGGQGRFAVNGPGSIDAAALTIDMLQVRSEGAGNSHYRARYSADVSAEGSGSVTVDGSPQCRQRGTATIRCG